VKKRTTMLKRSCLTVLAAACLQACAAPKAGRLGPTHGLPLDDARDAVSSGTPASAGRDCTTTCTRKRDYHRTEECRTVCKEEAQAQSSRPSPSSDGKGARLAPGWRAGALVLFAVGMVLWIFL
jgi:hypothetical protein